MEPRTHTYRIDPHPCDTYLEGRDVPLSHFDRDLIGLAKALQATGWADKYHADGSHVLPVDANGHLSPEGLKTLLAGKGITRPEQLGDHDLEITAQEFADYARDHLQKPGDFTKLPKVR
ncbi:MAG: hypothetical protein WDN72_01030 [Alphaproteobacteria bacterium]